MGSPPSPNTSKRSSRWRLILIGWLSVGRSRATWRFIITNLYILKFLSNPLRSQVGEATTRISDIDQKGTIHVGLYLPNSFSYSNQVRSDVGHPRANGNCTSMAFVIQTDACSDSILSHSCSFTSGVPLDFSGGLPTVFLMRVGFARLLILHIPVRHEEIA